MQTDEVLVSAETLERKGILPKGTAYRMARTGQLPSYVVGTKGRGVRFRVEEVLAALRRRPRSISEGDKAMDMGVL